MKVDHHVPAPDVVVCHRGFRANLQQAGQFVPDGTRGIHERWRHRTGCRCVVQHLVKARQPEIRPFRRAVGLGQLHATEPAAFPIVEFGQIVRDLFRDCFLLIFGKQPEAVMHHGTRNSRHHQCRAGKDLAFITVERLRHRQRGVFREHLQYTKLPDDPGGVFVG